MDDGRVFIWGGLLGANCDLLRFFSLRTSFMASQLTFLYKMIVATSAQSVLRRQVGWLDFGWYALVIPPCMYWQSNRYRFCAYSELPPAGELQNVSSTWPFSPA